MAKSVRINVSIDADLNERWTKVAKRLKMTKSGILADLLNEIIPILEQEDPKDLIKMALHRASEQFDATASLFDYLEFENEKKGKKSEKK